MARGRRKSAGAKKPKKTVATFPLKADLSLTYAQIKGVAILSAEAKPDGEQDETKVALSVVAAMTAEAAELLECKPLLYTDDKCARKGWMGLMSLDVGKIAPCNVKMHNGDKIVEAQPDYVSAFKVKMGKSGALLLHFRAVFSGHVQILTDWADAIKKTPFNVVIVPLQKLFDS